MFRIIPVLAACALSYPAAAQVYKCNVGGKVAYGDRPCASGETIELKVPAAPSNAPAEARDAGRRSRVALQENENRRRASEERAERELARERRAAAAQRRKCDRLRLQRKWADEDLARATGAAAEAARIKARRQAEALAVECPA